MITAGLIFLPLLAGLFSFLIRNEKVRNFALSVSIAEFVLAVLAFAEYVPSAEAAFVLDYSWIPAMGINFSIGMDGISLLMVMLTTFLTPLIIYSSFRKPVKNPSVFYGLILIMQAALVGVFVARDAFLFYIFWELALIPIYFIALLWGGENRLKVTFKFFIYTLAGSLIMLMAIIYMYLQTPGSFHIDAFYGLSGTIPAGVQGLLFWAFFVAFAIKMPIFPFHTWQPDTYTTAPIQGTMLMAGIMLKMGIYGVIRWLLPVVPAGVEAWATTAIVLSVIGIIYASIIAIKQKDFKRLIAYVSIAHVGLISAGIFTNTIEGLQGGIIQMLSHGITVVGMFYIIDLLYARTKTTMLDSLGGIRTHAPVFAFFFLVILMASIALPLTSGFVGEFLLFIGIFQHNYILAGIAGLTIIFGAVYMLSSYQKIMLGEDSKSTSGFQDLVLSEKVILVPVLIAIFWIGLYPKTFLDVSEPAVANLLETIRNTYTLK
ncbi:NADH-quinone oxidoreductase subunit M [Cytophagaceae bacterium ABcell3]|nr:NADH-quinone oxidoreductase subunit M [Cytophagaceae bacterium ABcell3]